MPNFFANSSLPDARVVVVGMPLDRTSSYIPGTRFGPAVARLGTANIESFSPYLRRDISTIPIHDAGDLEFTFETAARPGDLIRETTRAHYEAGKKQLAVGGEHSITPFIIAELAERLPGLCVIQFDAHSDLREEFLGEPESHATAMRRVLDHIPRENLFQLGIRSFFRPDELQLPNLFPFEVLEPVKRVRDRIGNRPVYISLDIDVLDPAFMPEVQTPQPGGCSYSELVRALAGLQDLEIVGADLVEFCPRTHTATAAAATAAELVRELILLLSMER